MHKDIAEKVSNLIAANWEAIERDWLQSRKESETPESVKFPVAVKVELTSPDGIEKKAKIKLEWSVIAKRVMETSVDNDRTPELPME